MIKLSVLLINKNRRDSVEWCINSIICQLDKEDQFIVIDDSSDDDSLEIIKSYSGHIDKIIEFSSNGNRSAVRNRAAREAVNEILVFIDSDVIIAPDNLRIVRETHEDTNIAGLNGTVYGNNHTLEQFELITHCSIEDFDSMVKKDFSNLSEYKLVADYRSLWGHFVADTSRNWPNYFTSFATARRELFEEIGGFDENFHRWGVEDMEFAYRLNPKGKIVFVPEIVSYHRPHNKNQFENAYSNLQNLYYMLNKYRNRETEMICCWGVNTDPRMRDYYDKIYAYIKANNTYEEITLLEGEVAVYFCLPEHENGLVEYVEHGERKRVELFGYALPFVDGRFKRVFVSGAYSLIPPNMFGSVLQELIRISGKVLISKNIIQLPSYYDVNASNDVIFLFGNIFGVTHIIQWYDRYEYDENYYEMKWKDGARLLLSKQVEEI
ncbi:MAG: glycosyltransferase [Oscillospiraceae bacterium]|jgi:glycosyltransferase involved in cell wall biosynthesis|nr:glycosyltransferase [Oscillospiraceae bacterium]